MHPVAWRPHVDVDGRKLEDYVRESRGFTKTHEAPPEGRIARLFLSEGYGFIATADGREIYFHRNAVLDEPFDGLDVELPSASPRNSASGAPRRPACTWSDGRTCRGGADCWPHESGTLVSWRRPPADRLERGDIDYGRLATLDGAVEYLAGRLGTEPRHPTVAGGAHDTARRTARRGIATAGRETRWLKINRASTPPQDRTMPNTASA